MNSNNLINHKTDRNVKECPICHEKCFVDMDVCYGCLHRFEKEEVDNLGILAANESVFELEQIEEEQKEDILQKKVMHDLSGWNFGKRSEESDCDSEKERNRIDKESLLLEEKGKSLSSIISNGFEVVVQIRPIKA